MMIKFLLEASLQCVLLASAQVFLKLSVVKMEPFSWTWHFFRSLLTNWQFAVTGLLFGSSTVLWFHILRHYPFSLAYPFTGVSYVLGMLAAMWVFHETIPATRWIGVALILLGVIFLAKQ